MAAEKEWIPDLQIEQGAKGFSFLKIAEMPGSSVELPVGIVNGSRPGPVLCLTAGTHGAEYAGIDAAIRIYNELDAKQICGTVITVPVVNLTGFDRATPYVCPIDNLNMGFQFPGKPNGTLSETTAHFLLNEIVSKSDFHVDLHGGDLPEVLVPYTIFFRSGNEKIDRESVAMARLYDVEYIEERKEKGSSAQLWPLTGLVVEASKRGIPSIVGEAGSMGLYNEHDIAIHLNGVRNIMKYLKMVEGKTIAPSRRQKKWSDVAVVTSKRGGLFYPQVRAGDIVSEGQRLGYVMNLKGETTEQISSPKDGFIVIAFWKHIVNTGDAVFNIGLNAQEFE